MARKITSDNPLERQKVRAQRIDHQYFEKPHPWRVWMRRLSWLVPLLGGAVAIALVLIPGGEAMFIPGPVSGQHAPFGQRCGECHEQKKGQWGAVLDSKCMACHDAPIHSPNTIHASGNIQVQVVPGRLLRVSTPGCVSCHTEHRGRTSITHLEEGRCVQCHGDLKRNDGAVPAVAKSIHDFDHEHPEWKMMREDKPDTTPYRLNHQLHTDIDRVTWPREIAEEVRHNPAILCAQCHQPELNGAYFKPINYASHCATCHGMEKFAPAIEPVGKMVITHGEAKRVVTEITAQVASYLARNGGTPAMLRSDPAKPADEDDDAAKKKAAPVDKRTAEQWIHETVQQGLQPLFVPSSIEKEGKSCLKCHVSSGVDESGVLQISTQKIPRVWLENARFNHHSHQTVTCASCHNRAKDSQFTTDVLLPGIANCRACHSTQGGARAECVECHRFHDRKLSNFKSGRSIEALSIGPGSANYVPRLGPRTASEVEAIQKHLLEAEGARLDVLKSSHATWQSAQQKSLAQRAEEQRAREAAVAVKPAPEPVKFAPEVVKPVPEIVKPVLPEPVKSIVQKPLPQGSVVCPHCKKEWPGDAKFCGRCGILMQQAK